MMSDESRTAGQIEMEAAVVRALEHKPEIAVPTDFAAKLTLKLPQKAPLSTQIRPVFGRIAGYFGAVAMMIVLLVLARIHPEAFEAGRGFVFAIEMVLMAQLLAVGYWLGMKRDGA